MKNIFFIPILMSVFLLSCGKKNVSTAVQTSAPACDCANNGTVTSTNNQIKCIGFLNFFEYQYYQNDSSINYQYLVNALFNKTPSLYESYNNNNMVYNVMLNNINLGVTIDHNSPYYSFNQGSPALFSNGLYWQVNGTNEIPSINHRWESASPTANFKGLPATISKSDLRAFPVNMVNCDNGGLSINLNTRETSYNINFTLYKGSNCICITNEQIKNFPKGEGTIEIWLNNFEYAGTNGQYFSFRKSVIYSKPVKIID